LLKSGLGAPKDENVQKRDIIRWLRPANVMEVTGYARRMPRAMVALLSANRFVVEQVLKIAADGSLLYKNAKANPKWAPRDLHRLSRDLTRSLRARLRYVCSGANGDRLVNIILMECTAALAHSRGMPCEYEVMLEMRRPGQEWTYLASNQVGFPLPDRH
jgi:hypothetical protein